MRKIQLLFWLLLGVKTICCAQKNPIDTSVFGKWASTGEAKLSNDGRYVLYTIDTLTSDGGFRTVLVVQSVSNRWRIKIENPKRPFEFMQDNRHAILLKEGDSMLIVTLGTFTIDIIPNVRSFKVSKEWLAYQSNVSKKEIRIRNISTGEESFYSDGSNYFFVPGRNAIILQSTLGKDGLVELEYRNLIKKRSRKIWKGAEPSSFSFDATRGFLVFASRSVESTALWYYKFDSQQVELLTNDKATEVDTDLQIGQVHAISKDGRKVFFTLKRKPKVDNVYMSSNLVKVDVWSYSDLKLPPSQLNEEAEDVRSFLAVLWIDSKKMIQIEREFEWAQIVNGNVCLVSYNEVKGEEKEYYWNRRCQKRLQIVSLVDGSRKVLLLTDGKLSPNGKYIIYYDSDRRNYFTYSVKSEKITNITREIKTEWTEYKNDVPDSSTTVYNIVGWMTDDSAVFLQDRYDIWKVDPQGSRPAENITNGYGRHNNIVFSRLTFNDERFRTIKDGERLWLTAFNRTSKENGFFSKKLGEDGDPKKLSMGAYFYYAPNVNRFVDPYGLSSTPIIASDTDAFVVKRMNVSESPNFFFTKDFKSFIPLSNIYPEKEYNWMTSSLISWSMESGNYSQGILYKPEDFSPQKKYPLIFYYYERLSDNLNVYINPSASTGPMNIAWFVSHGFLVFTPDIYYKIGYTGESAYRSVVSAADFLSKMPFVDEKKMGIQGHSFGGYETNYIVTHTNIFAAACAAAGVTDFVSAYGQLSGGISRQYLYEVGQSRIAGTLWEKTDSYIRNSPVFYANRVNTPILLMYNKEDPAVPFSQGIEFFTALRRLNKRVWLLQYDGEGHRMEENGQAAQDYNIRLTQFFDHFLKNVLAPKWMTKGLPAKMKGIDNGLELDTIRTMPQ
jgi:dipeptidyl aminopeptidase/acylaminoacyl peptidase